MILSHLKGCHILPEFLNLRFLNTDMITSRFPSTSTTVVKIKTLARRAMTQAGRALPSEARVRSSCPSCGSVRFFMSANASGITGPLLLSGHSCSLNPAATAGTDVSQREHGAHLNASPSSPGARVRACYLKAI